jgi:hypothetical protein
MYQLVLINCNTIQIIGSDNAVLKTKRYTHHNYHIMYVFVKIKNIQAKTKTYIETIYCYTNKIKLFLLGLTGKTFIHNATTVGVVVKHEKNGLPIRSVCVFSNN